LGHYHLFCFGYGYSAKCLAPHLIERGWVVSATSRSITEYPFDGVTVVDFDKINKDTLKHVTHILVSVPPNSHGDPVLLKHTRLINDLPNLHWVGYLSTTGVYGNTDGALVNECSPLNPTNERSKFRLLAEKSWLGLSNSYGLPIHLFRLAGIYGSGRNTLKRVMAGQAQRIELPGQKFSRIHVEDMARVLIASMTNREPGEVYNVCDDEPASQSDVVEYSCKILGIKPPALISFEEAKKKMSPMTLSFWKDNRRVDNTKIKNNLGVSLLYPTYREGLMAILENEIG